MQFDAPCCQFYNLLALCTLDIVSLACHKMHCEVDFLYL